MQCLTLKVIFQINPSEFLNQHLPDNINRTRYSQSPKQTKYNVNMTLGFDKKTHYMTTIIANFKLQDPQK